MSLILQEASRKIWKLIRTMEYYAIVKKNPTSPVIPTLFSSYYSALPEIILLILSHLLFECSTRMHEFGDFHCLLGLESCTS